MEQNILNCKYKFSVKCLNITHAYMSDILKTMESTPNDGGSIHDSKYQAANTLCETCKAFKENI